LWIGELVDGATIAAEADAKLNAMPIFLQPVVSSAKEIAPL
jgi:hypothetical protein